MLNEKWDKRFLELSAHIASWSKDSSTKTGAVIVRPDKTIASMGYNGFVRGASDDPALYTDRQRKYDLIIHCEVNALIHAREPVQGYTLYTWPFACCIRCAVQMLQAGITHFVFPAISENLKGRWGESVKATKTYILQCGVTYLETGFPDDYRRGGQ